jgi:hypothetical protein
MCNVQMIRPERGLVSIPVQKAVYCENCKRVSNSAWPRCGLCGSELIVDLLSLLGGSSDPDPTPLPTPLALLREVA